MYKPILEILELCPCPVALLVCLVVLFLTIRQFNSFDKRLIEMEKKITNIYKLLISTAPAYKRPEE